MPRKTLTTFLALAAFTAVAASCERGSETPKSFPRETDWETVIEADFDVATVALLTIGGTKVADNFVNRGDVEVYVNGPAGKITVEMKRFDFVLDSEDTAAWLAAVQPWAYTGSINAPPMKMPTEDCTAVWQNDCKLRVYYAGVLQPGKSGAHMRVTLPSNYNGAINIVTEDNIEDTDYLRRSNVLVKDFIGNVSVTLGSGEVQLQASSELLTAPRCGATPSESAELNDECADLGWKTEQPTDCACGTSTFGQIVARSTTGNQSRMTLSLPADIWATVTTNNTSDDISLEQGCVAEYQGFSSINDDPMFTDENEPWKSRSELNDPGPESSDFSGLSALLEQGGCGAVQFHSSVEDYRGEPEADDRGGVLICADCLDIPNP